ncbi:MAG: hypothetical protein KAS32_14060, partial [Candidatus Peribacteraceae bacterium]|nr:hypothetical protein [Candidatus Peribacteraceae bacterium]
RLIVTQVVYKAMSKNNTVVGEVDLNNDVNMIMRIGKGELPKQAEMQQFDDAVGPPPTNDNAAQAQWEQG